MTTIEKPGKPRTTPLCFEHEPDVDWALVVEQYGGWDPRMRVLSPIKNVPALLDDERPDRGTLSAWFMADSLCAAYEDGQLTGETLAGAFLNRADLEEFIDFIEGDNAWVNERWYAMFVGLDIDPAEAVTFESIADHLRHVVLAEV